MLALLQRDSLNVHELLAVALLANEGLVLFRPRGAVAPVSPAEAGGCIAPRHIDIHNSMPACEYELIFKHIKAMQHVPVRAPATLAAGKESHAPACNAPACNAPECECDAPECECDAPAACDAPVCGGLAGAPGGGSATHPAPGRRDTPSSAELCAFMDNLDIPDWLESTHETSSETAARPDACV